MGTQSSIGLDETPRSGFRSRLIGPGDETPRSVTRHHDGDGAATAPEAPEDESALELREAIDFPHIGISLRWRIILPFMVLAIAIGVVAVSFVTRLMSETTEDRFVRQLADSGRQAADALVRAEDDLLDLERRIANTEGVVEAAQGLDAEAIRARVLPLVINAEVDTVVVLDPAGVSLVTIRRRPEAAPGTYDSLRGEAFYADWPAIQKVLGAEGDEIGDKRVGLSRLEVDGRETHLFYVGGPLKTATGRPVGVVLVGQYLDSLAPRLAAESGANVSVYEVMEGHALNTTLDPADPANQRLSEDMIAAALFPDGAREPVRQITVAGVAYREVLGAFTARQGTESLGVVGVSLLDTASSAGAEGLPDPTRSTITFVAILSAIVMPLLLLFGVLLSYSITRPLMDLARATSEVATGNLTVRLPEGGRDEMSLLARSFNHMVRNLRNASSMGGWVNRTLPMVDDAPPADDKPAAPTTTQGLSIRATILFAEIRSVERTLDISDPTNVLDALGEIYSSLIEIIRRHGGELSMFEGSVITATFGVKSGPLPPQISALQATHAGVAILEHLEDLNQGRRSQGLPELRIGIGVSTGPVISGGIGMKDGLRDIVVGDTVRTADLIQQVNYELDGSGVLLSEDTHRYLASTRSQFIFGHHWVAHLRGMEKDLMVYDVKGRNTRLVEAEAEEGNAG